MGMVGRERAVAMGAAVEVEEVGPDDEWEALLSEEAAGNLRRQRRREAAGWVLRKVRQEFRRGEREEREIRERAGKREYELLEEMAVVVLQCRYRVWRAEVVAGNRRFCEQMYWEPARGEGHEGGSKE